MKCNLCDQRKGKRFCPAKRATICAQCCGEKRVLIIDCPEDCEYLKVGRNHEAAAVYSRHLVSSDPVKRERHYRVLSSYEDVFALLNTLVAEQRHSWRDLSDVDLNEALELLIATLNTEDKGILYEKTSNNPRVEGIRKVLADAIKSRRYPKDTESVQRLLLREAIECLEVLKDFVVSHLEKGPGSLSYVDFLARSIPRTRGDEGIGSNIVIPGR